MIKFVKFVTHFKFITYQLCKGQGNDTSLHVYFYLFHLFLNIRVDILLFDWSNSCCLGYTEFINGFFIIGSINFGVNTIQTYIQDKIVTCSEIENNVGYF